jgi:endonuclease G
VGTGWLVAKDIVVTNRHVASVFGTRSAKGDGFTFRMGLGSHRIRARIDYREEFAIVVPEQEYQVTRILHVEDDRDGLPDVAFLQVAGDDDAPSPIPLSDKPARAADNVAVIGYPARDDTIPDPALMESIFHGIYNYKRLAPGLIMASADQSLIFHDSTTLPGNSGSVVLDLVSGQAVGLHFAGIHGRENRAVPAPVVKKKLEEVKAKFPEVGK